MELSYKKVLQEAACAKLLDISKEMLITLDQIRAESISTKSKLLTLLNGKISNEELACIDVLLDFFDENRKKSIRKRFLDKYNTLKRELEQ